MSGKLRWPLLYGLALTAFSAYVLLDAFVIPRSYLTVTEGAPSSEAAVSSEAESGSTAENGGAAENAAVITDSSYNDGSCAIEITQYRAYDTDLYVADITPTGPETLKTALAGNTYGKNVTAATSAIAEDNGAVLAINGDYYGARNGYVIRNGVLYRSTSASREQQDLVIGADGSFSIVREGDVTAEELLDAGAQQVLSFGPGLLEDGAITVEQNTEVDKARTSNPRTSIGILSPLHYVFVVADGRTEASAGLSLYELAEFMQGLGVQTTYNLDGGGSSTMVFNGTVVNCPTSDGRHIRERKVSDIVFIG